MPTSEPVRLSETETPNDPPLTGQVMVATTGIPIQFSTVRRRLPQACVFVTADADNAGAVTVGNGQVTNEVDGTGNGLVVPAGETRLLMALDLSQCHLNGTEDDWISYTAG